MKYKKQWYVYFLIHNKKVIYIGMSSNLRGRIWCHVSDKIFTSVRWFACKSRAKAAKYERRWILKFMPKYNKDICLTLKRRKMGIIKKYLPQHSIDLLKNIEKKTGVPMNELLKNPMTEAFYEYEKYQKP